MFWTWLWPSFWNTWWNNQQFTAPTKQQKFPWLTADQIKRLESLTSDPQEQQKLYQQAIQQLKADRVNENRIAAENELTYKSMWEKDIRQKNYMQSNVRLEQLADLTKQKFWLNADADTQWVINWLMAMAKDYWVSLDSLNNYLDSGDETFLYQMWLKEEEKKTFLQKVWQVGTDIVGWAYDSATSLARLWAKWLANAIWWTAKKLWADEGKADALVQSYKDYLDTEMSSKDIWADQESVAYFRSKLLWDTAQVIGWEWLLKAGVKWTAKGAELVKYLEKAPTRQKIVAGWLEWAGDMTLYSIVADNKLPTAWETGIGAAIWAAIPWGWALYKAVKPVVKKWASKVASKLEISGLLNPAKLNTIKNQLVNEWVDMAKSWLKGWTAEDVGTWMIERGFKWDKPTLINDLWEYAKKSHGLKREVLWISDTLHSVESANKALKVIYETIQDVPWLENRLERVGELIHKGKHTLSELDEIKSILDDTVDLYTNVWDVRAWANKKWLDLVRKDLKKYIEDAATEEWLGNIKMLNNETQIAKGLQDAISKKDSADAAREMLSVFSKWAIGGVAGYNAWPFDNSTLGGKILNITVWTLAWKYLFSTKAKTQFASLINKMSGWWKKELERLVAGDLSVKKLSKSTQKELANIFEKSGVIESWIPKELTSEEYEALLKKYSKSDLPALEFKEWVNDAWKNILVGDSEKIIATPEWVNVREWQVAELPKKLTKTWEWKVTNSITKKEFDDIRKKWDDLWSEFWENTEYKDQLAQQFDEYSRTVEQIEDDTSNMRHELDGLDEDSYTSSDYYYGEFDDIDSYEERVERMESDIEANENVLNKVNEVYDKELQEFIYSLPLDFDIKEMLETNIKTKWTAWWKALDAFIKNDVDEADRMFKNVEWAYNRHHNTNYDWDRRNTDTSWMDEEQYASYRKEFNDSVENDYTKTLKDYIKESENNETTLPQISKEYTTKELKGNAEINNPKNSIQNELSKLKPEQHEDYLKFRETKWKEYSENDMSSWFGDKAEDYEAYTKYKNMEISYANKWDKYTLDYQLKKIKEWVYNDAKIDYDNFLDVAAKETWWTAVKAPLKNVKNNWNLNGKWLVRVLEKAFKKVNWVDDITDIVRWTIWAKDKAHMEKIIKWAQDKGYKVDLEKFNPPTSLWYSDASFIYTAPNWIKCEVQINYPEMIAAKEWREVINMKMMTEQEYEALLKRVWEEWWKWHKYYEERRAINDKLENGLIKWEENIKAAEERLRQIEKESSDYYRKFYK